MLSVSQTAHYRLPCTFLRETPELAGLRVSPGKSLKKLREIQVIGLLLDQKWKIRVAACVCVRV